MESQMRNFDELLEEAKWGKLIGRESIYAAHRIKKGKLL